MQLKRTIAGTEDIQAARSAGMNGHIAKPINISGMIETIAEVLAQKSGDLPH